MTNCSLLFALLGGLALFGCNPGVDGNGERTEEVREAAAFSRIRSDCELDVQVVQGNTQSLIVSLDSNLQDLVETRVSNDTLYVNLKDNVDEMVEGPHILITVPQLSAAKLAGSGSMTLAFDEPEQPLDLYLSGSGDLRFSGTTAALGAYLSGSGEIRLDGETSDADLKLSGSGSIRGQSLAASSAAIDLSGSGNVSATVQDSVSVALSGSGQVDLYGPANVDSYRNTGSGDVVKH
jgi:Putative auto-transporter adhesin, head GIN domain